MTERRFDVLVLGAGMVGVSAALHLQARGRSVAILDKTGVAAETTFGNAGIIQSEAIFPYMFPQSLLELVRAAANQDPRAEIRHWALPRIAPALWRYFLASSEEGRQKSAAAMRGLVGAAKGEHIALAQAGGAMGLFRDTGWIKVFRTARGEESAQEEIEELRPYGVPAVALDRAALSALESAVGPAAKGGVHFPDPLTTSDPHGLTAKYAALFETRGGQVFWGDAMALREEGDRWTVALSDAVLAAKDVVVALGPWSAALVRRYGVRLPFFVKRGYHMHYASVGPAPTRPVLDMEKGYVLTPMTRGLRLTTGAEFAPMEDAPSPRHLDRIEPFAREIFLLGDRLDPTPWLGRRPCLPDMLPVISAAPRHRGLWLDFGHQHLGLTLGPASGRLLADLMTGATPFMDASGFSVERFGR
jgi:D-amino-acid dehydrogenase